MKYLLLMLVLIAPQTASARIGETVEQCNKRYGKPVTKDVNSMSYIVKGYLLTLEFHKSVCDSITYSKTDDSPIADEVIKNLMSKAGKGWVVVGVSPEWKVWETPRMRALYNKKHHGLWIKTSAYHRRGEAEFNKEELEAVGDF